MINHLIWLNATVLLCGGFPKVGIPKSSQWLDNVFSIEIYGFQNLNGHTVLHFQKIPHF